MRELPYHTEVILTEKEPFVQSQRGGSTKKKISQKNWREKKKYDTGINSAEINASRRFFIYGYIIEKQLKRKNNLIDTDTSMSQITKWNGVYVTSQSRLWGHAELMMAGVD